MHIRKSGFLLFAFLLFPLVSEAEKGHGHWVDGLKTYLKLDESQTTAIRQINKDAQNERKLLREKIAMRIDAVLTHEQRVKLKKFRKQEAVCESNPDLCASSVSESDTGHNSVIESPNSSSGNRQ